MKQFKKFLLILLFFKVIITRSIDQCNALSKLEKNCEFYFDCLEENYQCGPKGYPVGYGGKYCTRFLQYYGEFSEKGQKWIESTLVCLKKALIEEITIRKTQTCQNINKVAFDSHPNCYVASGFCEYVLSNPINAAKSLTKVFQIQDFLSITALKQIIVTAGKCGQNLGGFISVLNESVSKKFLSEDISGELFDPFNPFN